MKVSLASQIAAVEAVATGKATPNRPGQRELQHAHLQAAVATLRWVRQHEAALREAIERGGLT